MLEQITDQLTAVRLRQQFDRGFRWGTLGLLAGTAIGCTLLLLQRAGILPENQIAWLVTLGFTGVAFALGLCWKTSWLSTAQLVDGAYDLKDRAQSAVEFASKEQQDALQSLQISDALGRLNKIDPAKVQPYRIPRLAPFACCLLAVMAAVALVPRVDSDMELAQVEAIPVVLEQAQVLEDTLLEELEQLATETEDEELEELAQELQEAIEELKEPDVDQRDALAKLSEMQQAIAEAMEQMDVEQVDAQLEQLAQALEASEATEAASQALRSQQYDQAATELEKIDASTMERKERQAVADDLKKLAKDLGDGRKGQLSEAVTEMADGLQDGDSKKTNSAMCKAAGVCRKQGVKKKISQCLGCQLNRLSECKSCCQGSCNKPGSMAKRSKSPSNSAGSAASGQPLGEEKTKLDSTRRDESVTGISGEGPSERETLSAPEARQDAARSYQDRYAEYKKQMEEVIDSEPLPLGHRQTVRDYFEAIRPENGMALDEE